jgi:hypothetical protein
MATRSERHYSSAFPGVQLGRCLTLALNADANMGHAFGIFMAHVGTLRPCGAPAPVNL